VGFTHCHRTAVYPDHGRSIKCHIHPKDRATYPHYGIVCFHLNASAAAESFSDICPGLTQHQTEVNVAFGLRRVIGGTYKPYVTFFIEPYYTSVGELEFHPTTFHGHDSFTSLHKGAKGKGRP
jgi:hypothetical protein